MTRTTPVAAIALFLIVAPSAGAQLAGSYTINPALPATAVNYTSFGSAVAALNTSGVSGPVVFEVYDDAGPYLESSLFYSASVPALTSNLALGDNLAVVVFGQWTGVSAVNSVTFRAAPGDAPVLDANGHACVISWNGADYTTIEGLELKGALFDCISLYTPSQQNVLAATITRCHLHDCGRVGVLVYGNAGPVVDTVISNNLFVQLMTSTNGGSFSGFIRDGYISGRRDTNTQIVHNTFICDSMSTPSGWILGNYPSGTANSSFTRVQGNIFVKTVQAGRIFFYQTASATTPPILPLVSDGNCFFDTSGGVFASTLLYNAPQNFADLPAWQAGVTRDLFSIAADPTFGGNAPYHLASTSPCVSLVGPGSIATVDRDGHARDASPDAGADEFETTGSVLSIGQGCPGTGGLAPALTAVGFPTIGNLAFQVDVTQARPAAASFLYVATSLEPAPYDLGGGCKLYLNISSLVALVGAGVGPFGPVVTSAQGGASFPLPVPGLSFLVGQRVTVQVGISDPLVPAGFTVTNALDCTLN